MTIYKNNYFTGERALFGECNAEIIGATFGKGESPLKESRQINLQAPIFKWKYPLWYSQKITVTNAIFETMARSGIWYTQDITVKNSGIQAPKLFRRCQNVQLEHVHFVDAEETLWSCKDVRLTDVQVYGDYFGKDSTNVYLDRVSLVGNYCFDGAKNIEVHHSTFIAKDAFWNCEEVTIYDSTLSGEYLAWNTKHLTLVNCTIESNQGLCYIDHLTLKNCQLLQTDLAFEYCSDIEATVTTTITSVKNPLSGEIHAAGIRTLIMDATKIDPSKTTITTDTPITERKDA